MTNRRASGIADAASVCASDLDVVPPDIHIIDVPDSGLEDAIRFTNARTKREALVSAIADFNRRMRMAKPVDYAGTCENLVTPEDLQAQRRRRWACDCDRTSSWIHMLRTDGDPVVRERVNDALTNARACWCPPVQLELWNGAPRRAGAKGGAGVCKDASQPRRGRPWTMACDMARQARAGGVTVPAAAILIAACARFRGGHSRDIEERLRTPGNNLALTAQAA